MDDIERKILNELQSNSDRSVTQLSKALRLPRTTIHNRILKLKKQGIIERFKAILNMKKIGKPVTVLVHLVITSKESAAEVASRLKKMHNVEDVYITAGQFDIIIKVRFESNEELSKFIFDSKTGLRSWSSVERTDSMIVLEKVKESGEIWL